MTRAEFMQMLHEYMMINRGQRKGQAIWNLLNFLFPEDTEPFRGSNIDPFYNDANITPFLKKFGIE